MSANERGATESRLRSQQQELHVTPHEAGFNKVF